MRALLLGVAIALGCATADNLSTSDVLDRAQAAEKAEVKQVLIAWGDLARAYKQGLDEPAKARTEADAEALARTVLAKLRAGEAIEPLMAAHSSDAGTAKSGETYPVEAGMPYEPKFLKLSLRLAVGEAGVVRTRYGWHVLRRVR